MIVGVDWGTTQLRAFLIGPDGAVLDRRDSPQGMAQMPPGGFADALGAAIDGWGAERVLMAGMVGSRQGWVEAPYVQCPAGAADLAQALQPVAFAGRTVAIVPGLSAQDADGVDEVMRGEETQLVGALVSTGPNALVCLPGTHSKWARLAGGRVAGFRTHLTGEAFAALRGHTLLGRMMRDGPIDQDAFLRGVERAGQIGGLLHHLFGVRALGLFGRLPDAGAASYLSGLLIGHEIAAEAPTGSVHLIGEPTLVALYAAALAQRGITASIVPADATTRGLAEIADRAGWR